MTIQEMNEKLEELQKRINSYDRLTDKEVEELELEFLPEPEEEVRPKAEDYYETKEKKDRKAKRMLKRLHDDKDHFDRVLRRK